MSFQPRISLPVEPILVQEDTGSSAPTDPELLKYHKTPFLGSNPPSRKATPLTSPRYDKPQTREEKLSPRTTKQLNVSEQAKDSDVNEFFVFLEKVLASAELQFAFLQMEHETYIKYGFRDLAKSILKGHERKWKNQGSIVEDEITKINTTKKSLTEQAPLFRDNLFDLLLQRALISSKRIKNKALIDQCSEQFSSLKSWCQHDKAVTQGIRFAKGGIDFFEDLQKKLDKLVAFGEVLESDLTALTELQLKHQKFFVSQGLEKKLQSAIEGYKNRKRSAFEVLQLETKLSQSQEQIANKVTDIIASNEKEIIPLTQKIHQLNEEKESLARNRHKELINGAKLIDSKTTKIQQQIQGLQRDIDNKKNRALELKQALIDMDVKFKRINYWTEKIEKLVKTTNSPTETKQEEEPEFEKNKILETQNQQLEKAGPLTEEINTIILSYCGYFGYFFTGDVDIAKKICDYLTNLNLVKKQTSLYSEGGVQMGELDQKIYPAITTLLKTTSNEEILSTQIDRWNTESKKQQDWIKNEIEKLQNEDDEDIGKPERQDILIKVQDTICELAILEKKSEHDHLITKTLYQQLREMDLSSDANVVRLQGKEFFDELTSKDFKKSLSIRTKSVTQYLTSERLTYLEQLTELSKIELYLQTSFEKLLSNIAHIHKTLDQFHAWGEVKTPDFKKVESLYQKAPKATPPSSKEYLTKLSQILNPPSDAQEFANMSMCLLDLRDLLNQSIHIKEERDLERETKVIRKNLVLGKRLNQFVNFPEKLEELKKVRFEEIEAEISSIQKQLLTYPLTRSEIEVINEKLHALIQEKVDLELWTAELSQHLDWLKEQKAVSEKISLEFKDDDILQFHQEFSRLLDESAYLKQKIDLDYASYSSYSSLRGDSWWSRQRGDKKFASQILQATSDKFKILLEKAQIIQLWKSDMDLELSKKKGLVSLKIKKMDYVDDSITKKLTKIYDLFERQQEWLTLTQSK